MKRKKLFRTLTINLAVLGVLFVFIELTLGAWIIPENQLNFFGVLPNMDETYEITLYTDEPIQVRHTRDQYGLRGKTTFNQPEKIDILTIGGSTTFQKYIDDKDTWEAHLQAHFKKFGKDLKVASAGINGHSTHAHIKAFELWFPTIEKLKPQYIFFYIGINDYLPRPFLLEDRPQTKGLKVILQNRSIIYNALRRAKGAYLAKKNEFQTMAVDFSRYDFTSRTLLTEEYRQFYMDEYIPVFEIRVQKLIELSLEMGAEPVFITQPMALYKTNNGEVTGVDTPSSDFINGQPLTGVDAYKLLTYINQAIHKVCDQKYKIVELTSLEVWEESDFHDWFHNTPQGSKKVAEEMWKQLRAYLERLDFCTNQK